LPRKNNTKLKKSWHFAEENKIRNSNYEIEALQERCIESSVSIFLNYASKSDGKKRKEI